MKTRNSKIIYALIFIAAIFLIWYFFLKGNSIPAKAPLPESGGVGTLEGFEMPAGFALQIFAKDVPGARVIEIDPKGRLLVSETSEGKIIALEDTNNDNVADKNIVLASKLNKPHGIVIHGCSGAETEGCYLYVAERDMLSRFPYNGDGPTLGKQEDLMPIASSITDTHFTRSLLVLSSPSGFPMDDTILISVGSSCNVCHENDTDHAAILAFNIREYEVSKSRESTVYAKGLRNATFMTLNPLSGKIFATEMGRDNLGDNIPPDEINIIEQKNGEAQNYGWPNCYGKNIHDDAFDKNTYIRNPCMAPFETPSFIDLQAHSAPLGIAFIPEEGWPEQYWYNALVAFHGSWNRSEPTGYKIVRVKMNAKGEYQGTEDFITGWLNSSGQKEGRPVDIKVLPGGVAYISDDSAGVIYRLTANH